jgi:hypothetical protein
MEVGHPCSEQGVVEMAAKQAGKRDLKKEQRWREIIAEWKLSKLTGAAFCRQAGLKESTFYSWLKVIAVRDREVKGRASNGEAAFVPITVKAGDGTEIWKPGETRLERVEIWFQNGDVIRAAAITPRAVAELLTAVSKATC